MRSSDWSSDVCSSDLGQYVALHLSDAMFRRNRSAEVDNVRIDEPADRRAMFGEPCRAIDTGGRLDMMVDVAVAQMPEGPGAYPRKGAFQPVRLFGGKGGHQEIGRASGGERVCTYV